MLQHCANRDCFVQFATDLNRCPACGTVAPPRPEASRSGPSHEQIERGRLIVFGYLIFIMAISLGVVSLYLMARGVTARLPFQIVRVVLTAALCFWLYRGSVIARWILVALLAWGGVSGLILAIGSGQPTVVLIAGGMAVVYLSFVCVMVTSRSVAAFLDDQREKYGTA
jgi:hypothetical protein